ILLIGISIFPLAWALRLSFMQDALLSVAKPRFIGFTNYTHLFHDRLFWTSLGVTAVFALSVLTFQLVIGLAIALGLDRLPRYQQVLATILLIPSILSPSVVSFQWKQLFDYNNGVLNWALGVLHLPLQGWTASARGALPALVLVDFWEWTPFMVLLMFAGIKSLPRSVFEAARVDGSSGWQTLLFQTLPLLRRVIAIAVILRLIGAFKIFDIIYTLTAGGPGTTTESLAFYTYVQGFRYFDLGYSTAMAFITLILITILARLILGFMERPVGRPAARAA
ncbi:MAG: sugar ABC transporter permease, partial [Candidatus Dormibacteraeota bacterium]|nr:sugar ABC transporter permease [Candidatus Dormibacteraeota bacterium]